MVVFVQFHAKYWGGGRKNDKMSQAHLSPFHEPYFTALRVE
jgi:hypothetical protein